MTDTDYQIIRDYINFMNDEKKDNDVIYYIGGRSEGTGRHVVGIDLTRETIYVSSDEETENDECSDMQMEEEPEVDTTTTEKPRRGQRARRINNKYL